MARVVPVAFLLACGSAEPQGGGQLEAHWRGAETGTHRSTATVLWCPEARFAEVLGVEGDTGVAIAIRFLDSLAPGRYPAMLPDSADTTVSSATVALRFLSRTSVTGYQSDSGEVTVARGSDGRLALDFDVGAKVTAAAARISLRGHAKAVPVQQGGPDCTPPPTYGGE